MLPWRHGEAAGISDSPCVRSCEQSVEMCPHGSPSAEAMAREPANSSDSSPARALARKHRSSSREGGQVRACRSASHEPYKVQLLRQLSRVCASCGHHSSSRDAGQVGVWTMQSLCSVGAGYNVCGACLTDGHFASVVTHPNPHQEPVSCLHMLLSWQRMVS